MRQAITKGVMKAAYAAVKAEDKMRWQYQVKFMKLHDRIKRLKQLIWREKRETRLQKRETRKWVAAYKVLLPKGGFDALTPAQKRKLDKIFERNEFATYTKTAVIDKLAVMEVR